ncbi:O-antigen ligase family protein [Methylosinus sp. H3A]|uniref:O-antigen ligase family protein n=1 Tax=Methylosinus sp. H3A TaxID=2785786 RepID=UPI0018C2EC7D|nr:O-antigen ligase family protein [Methylosinus sp. H3A]MBG0811719.1 O-antigen ligase family protein [Methylosinus sp. H3A]
MPEFTPSSRDALLLAAKSRAEPARPRSAGGLFGALWAEGGFDALLLFGLIAGLAWAPFWLGGNRLPAWGVNGLYFPALAILFEIGVLFGGRRHPVSIATIAGPAALFGATLLWIFFQASPLASGASAHPIWGMASEMLERPLEGGVSVDRGQTLVFLLRLTTAASVFWLALQLSRRPLRVHLLLRAIVVIVTAYAVYGLVLSAFFAAAIPFFDAPALGLFVRSTFVNRNNFATYAGLGLVTTLALILPLADRDAPSETGSRAYRLSKIVEAAGLRAWLLLAAAFVIFVALLGTVSRGGILATILGAGALLAIAYSRGRRRRGESVGAIALVLAGLGATILFFGDLIVARLFASGFDDGRRLAVFAIALRAILDTPLFGYGYGAFADVFPLYRDRSIPTADVWDKAHNAYLETFMGLGLVFGTALIGALLWLAAKCFAGAVARRRAPTPAAAAAACSLLIGVHALVDFGVQIEAVALTYMAILGAGVAQAESSRISLSD